MMSSVSLLIRSEAPTHPEVVELLEAHLDFSRRTSPADHVHALNLNGLSVSAVSFFAAREDDELLGVGALRELGNGRAEIKSMHTSSAARGRGVGRSMLQHLINTARHRGVTWLGLETGSMDEFAPARSLYESAGFVECEPFDRYTRNAYSICMSISLNKAS
jgi:putative acetyltransferase